MSSINALFTFAGYRSGIAALKKGRLTARFAALRIRIADGSTQRILDKGQQPMPGEEAWLLGERRSNGERKHYLSNLPAEATVKQLAAAIKARRV